jgi:hypothetical protein
MIGGTKCSLVFERWHHATKCGRVAAKDRPPAETNFGLRMLPQWSSGRVRKVSRFNVGVTVNTAYETFRTYQYQITSCPVPPRAKMAINEGGNDIYTAVSRRKGSEKDGLCNTSKEESRTFQCESLL